MRDELLRWTLLGLLLLAPRAPAGEELEFAALDIEPDASDASGDSEPVEAEAPARSASPDAPRASREAAPGSPPACLAREPAVADVIRAAWRQGDLQAEADRSRLRRLRTSGFLPKLSGGVAWDTGDRWDYRYEPGTPRVDQLQQDDGLKWDVGLSLDLSQMAYHGDELAVARESVKRAGERRQLALEIVRLFFARRRLTLQGLPPPGSEEATQLLELTALLDAWTGGRFRGRWCGGGR